MLKSYLDKKLIINIGKGGVGKSSISAALALHAARQGKRVLVCEVNAKERMSSMLGGERPKTLKSLDQIWKVRENIWTVNIQPRDSMKEYVVQVLRFALLYNVVFENRLMKAFLKAVPGLQELIFIGKIWYHVTEKLLGGRQRFDLVIVDSPATGHGIAMLKIAQVVLSIVPIGPMHNAAKNIQDLLQDTQQTQINLISLPEEMPASETAELHRILLNELHLQPHSIFLNQWPSPPFDEQLEPTFERLRSFVQTQLTLAPLFTVAESSEYSLEKAREVLQFFQHELPLPIFQLPRFLGLPNDKDLIEKLTDALDNIAEIEKK